MATPVETPNTKMIVERLTGPPFNKTVSMAEIHDEWTEFQLVQLISEVMAYLDSASGTPSVHAVDIRQEQQEDTVTRIIQFLAILKFGRRDLPNLRAELLEGNRQTLLQILHFLLEDMNIMKKRAYLAPFLLPIEIPPEFYQEGVADLHKQYRDLQEQFKEIHKSAEMARSSSTNIGELKREIAQMEEEKQQIFSKISRLKKRVEEVPNHEAWLEASRKMRAEQEVEAGLIERQKEQKSLLAQADQRLSQIQQKLRDTKNASVGVGSEALLIKMRDEVKMNRFLCTEKLPKSIEERRNQINELSKMLSLPGVSSRDLERMEDEAAHITGEISALTESKMIKNNPIEDKLGLFRQQAAMISRKKESTADKLKEVQEELQQLQQEVAKKESQVKASGGSKVLKGEELKRYVSELRGKSGVYKRKKAELSEIAAEHGILQRTEQILRSRDEHIEEFLGELEKKKGIAGFHVAQDSLEKVSEKKEILDEEKGKTLQEISEMVNKIVSTIQAKKNQLSPVIKDLRTVRQKYQELEAVYSEKKRTYEATMVGLDSETSKLEAEMRTYQAEIASEESRYHYLNEMIKLADLNLEKVMTEMKCYIGGDESIEQLQKARGYKSYRDLYNKRITEQETLSKNLREKQKDIKNSYEPNIKQLALFNGVKKLLEFKVEWNKAIAKGDHHRHAVVLGMNANEISGGAGRSFETSTANANVLVL